MFKNTSGQKLTVFAFDSTTNAPKTGDASNITAYVSKDDGTLTVLADTTATEVDSTNGKGYYLFDLAQAETNADKLLFSAKSSTSNIVVIGVPAVVYTLPANFTATAITSGGIVQADVQTIKTQAVTAAAGVTFPTSIASPTNITAGTITTTTNLTNLPTAPTDWVTAAAVSAAAVTKIQSGLSTYAGGDTSGTTTLLSRVTSTRAGYLDNLTNLDAAVSSRSTFDPTATGVKLTSAGLDLVVIETGINARQAMSAIMASAAGVLSGADTATIVIKGGGVATTRITATTDADGNRSAITLNLPS